MNMRYVATLILLLGACDRGPTAPTSAQAPVTLFAASSLKEVVTEIAAEWSRRTGRPTRPQFEASSTLARQIREGAPVDVFVTAAPEWLDQVKVQDRYDWLSNRLVCVVPKEAKDFDLKAVDSLALANEQVPAGKYARAALASQGVKIPERTIYGANVRDVLSKVSQGGAKAGIVYATDAAIDPGVRIAYTFPPESHPKILYSAGLLTPSGKLLFDALREPWAKEIATRHGFADVR
jgi:molybdate transport system substrate-binding protein